MAAARLRAADRARDREHLAVALQRQPRGDQRARLQRGLHHQRAQRQPGDQPVALREMRCQRSGAEHMLADDQAACSDDARGQRLMLARIAAVDAGADDRHRRRAGIQRAQMGGRVDALRQSGDDAQAVATQSGGELARQRGAAGGRMTAADQRDQIAVVQALRCAVQVQQQRRVGHVHPARRVALVAEDQQMVVGMREPVQRGVDQRIQSVGRRAQRLHQRLADDLALCHRRGGEHALGRAEGREQLARALAAAARRLQQPQPGGDLVGRVSGQRHRRAPGPAQGWVKRSPGRTAVCASRISA